MVKSHLVHYLSNYRLFRQQPLRKEFIRTGNIMFCHIKITEKWLQLYFKHYMTRDVECCI